jgi:hypothetical protein
MLMLIIRLGALGLAASFISAVSAKPVLVGTYRLVSEEETVVATGEVTILGNLDRSMLGSGTLGNAGKARMFDAVGGYGGTYTFDGKKVTHYVDISTRQLPIGTGLVRYVEQRGDDELIYYSTGPTPSPRDGALVDYKLIWRKVSARHAASSTARSPGP